MHGRDQLHQLFPELYTEEAQRRAAGRGAPPRARGRELRLALHLLGPPGGPADGGARVRRRRRRPRRRRAEYEAPLLAFPGHWAPNDLLFYTAEEGFPAPARGGAFIAFHGSWNRAPLPQSGYQVVFVPFDGAAPAGDWSVFADGFKGAEVLADPDEAEFRAMGLAQGAGRRALHHRLGPGPDLARDLRGLIAARWRPPVRGRYSTAKQLSTAVWLPFLARTRISNLNSSPSSMKPAGTSSSVAEGGRSTL